MEKVKIDKHIILIKDIISKTESELLLNIAKNASEDDWHKYNETDRDAYNEWDDRILLLNSCSLYNNNLDYIVNNILNRIKTNINEHLGKDHYEYTGFNSIYRARPGESMNPHHDGGLGPKFKYGIVLYLNDNFEGGEVYYPNLNIEIKPIANALVMHPANQIHRHGVKEVSSAIRYYMTTFIKLP